MEKQLNQKIEQFQIQFKHDIKQWLTTHRISMTNETSAPMNGDFLKFIYDYTNMQLNENDLKKRKRIKNIVPQFELCIAKRANGEQCTRRKRTNEEGSTEEPVHFCGTHIKGVPHGVVGAAKMRKLDLRAEDIGGIIYWLDAAHQVYKTEDVMNKKTNPAVIGTWVRVNDQYELTV